MDPVAISIGPLVIRWYGLIIATALALGTYLASREAERQGIDPEHILNIVIIAAPTAFIGARLYYVLFNWKQYAGGPLLEYFAIWHGGIAIHGAIIAGFLAGYIYVRKNNLSFWQLADIVAVSLVLGQAIGRWGNFFNQEAHGGPVSYDYISRFPEFIQNGMLIGGQYYHPTFLYESIWNFLVFFFLLFLRRKESLPKGTIILTYLITYSIGRFVIEGLRTDSLMFGSFRVAQLISIALIIVSGYLMNKKFKEKRG